MLTFNSLDNIKKSLDLTPWIHQQTSYFLMFSQVIKGGIDLKRLDWAAVASEFIRSFNYIPVGKYVFKDNNKDTGIASFERLMNV